MPTILRSLRVPGESWETLRGAYAERSCRSLRSALNYYELYPEETDARLAREAAWTPERVAPCATGSRASGVAARRWPNEAPVSVALRGRYP